MNAGHFSLEIRLFAVVRQLAGTECLRIELPGEATVGDVRRALVAQMPQLESMGHLLAFAVDEQYASDATRLTPESDVACIPPVSGG
ncbi:MAG: MoaD/ThiS family protein [Pirellulales bacterium]|nr:MoaD/ThiS family protein [Pirellulales bacterium]